MYMHGWRNHIASNICRYKGVYIGSDMGGYNVLYVASNIERDCGRNAGVFVITNIGRGVVFHMACNTCRLGDVYIASKIVEIEASV
jgi:hypothetical protein